MSFNPFSCRGSNRTELIVETIQRIGGFLSTFGSSLILSDIAKKVRNGKETDPYQRIMVGMSIFDILYSFFLFFLGTWMAPVETGSLWAKGNMASCTAQGFFFMFGGSGEVFYQGAISLNIWLLIVFGWKQDKFAEKVEKPMHIIIITLTFLLAGIPLAFQNYGPACGGCRITTIRAKCSDTDVENMLCKLRGNERVGAVVAKIRGSFLVLVLVFSTVTMVWVYLHVKRQEKRNKQYVFRGSAQDRQKESERIRKILFLYTLSLYFAYGPLFVFVIVAPTQTLFSIFRILGPTLGFFNMLVYFLPNCLKYQKDHPGTWLVTAYFRVVCPCPSGMCGGKKEDMEDAPEMNFAKFNKTIRLRSTEPSSPNDTEPSPCNETEP